MSAAHGEARPAAEMESTKSFGRNPFLWIVLAVTITALGAWWLSARQDQSTVGNGGESTRVRFALHLDTFVLNLADADQRSFLRVGIDLGLRQEPGKNENIPVAKVRDTILGVLALAKLDDLMTAKGKLKLKEDLLHTLQERLPELGVAEVYFTEFLIQR